MYPPTAKPMSFRRFTALIAGILITAGIGLFFVDRAHGQEPEPVPFKLERPPCYPLPVPGFATFISIGSKVVDARLRMKADTDVAVWWCETPTGLWEEYRAGNFGAPCEEGFRVDINNLDLDTLFSIDRACTRRPISEKEAVRLDEAERLYTPRCSATGTATTSVVRDKTGNPLLDPAGVQVRITTAAVRTGCRVWSLVSKGLFCSVDGQPDTKGRAIVAGYLPCSMKRAPKEGWPDSGVVVASN